MRPIRGSMATPPQIPVPSRPKTLPSGDGGKPASLTPGGGKPPVRSDMTPVSPSPTSGPKPLVGSMAGVTQTMVPGRGMGSLNLGTAGGPGGGRPTSSVPGQIPKVMGGSADKMGPMMGRGGAQSVMPAFKKGGMVNAKKKSSAGKPSSCRPRGSSGKGVKSCKVC
jgi:hypothetical protein